MADCIFCKIIKGEIPCKKLYEDEHVLAFLDIHPDKPGHTLIIPKKHILDLTEMDKETIGYITEAAKKLFPILKEKLNFDGLKCVQNNGIIQEVKHYHLHLLPIYKNEPTLSLDEIYEILTK